MHWIAIFFPNHWFTIICILGILGCVVKTSEPKKRIGGIVLIILILFMEWFLQ